MLTTPKTPMNESPINDLVLTEISDNSWRIDASINLTSRLCQTLALCWLAIMLLVMLVSDLAWWQWLLVILLTLVLMMFCRWQRLPVIHLTQPRSSQLSGYAEPWHLYVVENVDVVEHVDMFEDVAEDMADTDGVEVESASHQLWQGHLVDIQDWHYLQLLHFDIIEPLPRSVYLLVWRDQLEHDAWRRLKTLATMH